MWACFARKQNNINHTILCLLYNEEVQKAERRRKKTRRTEPRSAQGYIEICASACIPQIQSNSIHIVRIFLLLMIKLFSKLVANCIGEVNSWRLVKCYVYWIDRIHYTFTLSTHIHHSIPTIQPSHRVLYHWISSDERRHLGVVTVLKILPHVVKTAHVCENLYNSVHYTCKTKIFTYKWFIDCIAWCISFQRYVYWTYIRWSESLLF